MNLVRSLLAHTDKTRAVLMGMTLGARGWQLGNIDPVVAAGPQVYLYAWDKPSAWALLCSVPLDSFTRISQEVRQAPDQWEAVRGALGQALREAAAVHLCGVKVAEPDYAGADGKPLSWEEIIGFLLCAYAGTTKTLAVSGTPQAHSHFITLHYRSDVNAKEGLLRPFMAPSKVAAPLTADEFLGAVQHVCGIDFVNHPEWFSSR